MRQPLTVFHSNTSLSPLLIRYLGLRFVLPRLSFVVDSSAATGSSTCSSVKSATGGDGERDGEGDGDGAPSNVTESVVSYASSAHVSCGLLFCKMKLNFSDGITNQQVHLLAVFFARFLLGTFGRIFAPATLVIPSSSSHAVPANEFLTNN